MPLVGIIKDVNLCQIVLDCFLIPITLDNSAQLKSIPQSIVVSYARIYMY